MAWIYLTKYLPPYSLDKQKEKHYEKRRILLDRRVYETSKYYEENRPLLRREEHPEAILCQRFRRALLHGEGSREAPADPPVIVSCILAGRFQGDAGGRCR